MFVSVFVASIDLFSLVDGFDFENCSQLIHINTKLSPAFMFLLFVSHRHSLHFFYVFFMLCISPNSVFVYESVTLCQRLIDALSPEPVFIATLYKAVTVTTQIWFNYNAEHENQCSGIGLSPGGVPIRRVPPDF